MVNQLQKAIIASIEAGKKILDVYNRLDFEIELKADQSPLTLADRVAHDTIIDMLSDDYPTLSEEGKSISWDDRSKWKTFWLIDPLDGTKEFIKRNDEFTVNIALIDNGIPVLGVIYVPVLRELYYGDKNGSYKCILDSDDDSLIDYINANSKKLPLIFSNKDYIVVGSRSHLNPETEDFIKNINTKGKTLKMVTKGSSLKLCLVASGEADIYPRLGPTMEWDIAAGHAIAKFAGKDVIKFDGTPMVYNKNNLLNPWFIVQ